MALVIIAILVEMDELIETFLSPICLSVVNYWYILQVLSISLRSFRIRSQGP